MATISQPDSVDRRPELKPLQVRLPEQLLRRAKLSVAANGSTLQELVKNALEQYLGTEGKAA